MSTDIFGVRVLGVDPDRREVRFRVFVVYYETAARSHLSPPGRDRGFHLGLLWESGRWDHPIGEATISVEQILDDDWRAANARWFVEDVECTARRNDPPSPECWELLNDFYHERAGRWRDEDHLVQADYTVRVTHERWIEHLSEGDAWGSTWYPLWADDPRPEDLPHLPDLRDPVAVLEPFDGGEAEELAFSDDGRYLAVLHGEGELVVYATATWSEHARESIASGFVHPRLMWVPGRPVITVLDREDDRQAAYDADARVVTAVPEEGGFARSRTGRHRVEFGYQSGVRFLGGPTVLGSGEDRVSIGSVSFTEDESRLFAAGTGPVVHVIDPGTGVVDRIDEPCDQLWAVAVSPDGAYLATSLFVSHRDERQEVRVRRVGRPEIATRHRPGAFVPRLEWSPDGRLLAAIVNDQDAPKVHLLPVGLPAEPPEALRPPPGGPRTREPKPELDPQLTRELAFSGDPVTQDELDVVARDHSRWVDSGGGFGGFQTLAVGGLVIAVYEGPNGKDGSQARLANRMLPSDLGLREVALPWADLTGVVGESVDLSGAYLRGATITDAHLSRACLRNAILRDADLSRADLRDADLSGADLTGTDLEDADLTGARLDGAKGI
ncbi:pentapeptide repeat-containing protein [Actinomadura oligospora]|uniref:pentapeptide repeat-containing protein n=1 Tax=Actinomadura oligospora TaxID=111804 RepID=UPI0004BBC33C|nr:pentapeptide repeat-containing protein [Actinomadura oligospora]